MNILSPLRAINCPSRKIFNLLHLISATRRGEACFEKKISRNVHRRFCTQPPPPPPAANLNKLYYVGGITFVIALTSYYYKTQWSQLSPESKTKGTKLKITKIPSDSLDIPDHIQYLLVGGGTASFAAFRAIKSTDPLAKVLVISNEMYLPYMRPPLSKEIWSNESPIKNFNFKQWNGTERSLFYEPEDFYVSCAQLPQAQNGGVAVARGWKVEKIDAKKKIAYLDDGKEIRYEKCLVATGAKPKKLELFERASPKIKKKVNTYRNISDFENVSQVFSPGNKVAIIGGGFLGSELACALARYGKKNNLEVVQIFRENGNMAHVLPEYLSNWTTEKVKAEGVEVVANSEVQDAKLSSNGKLSLVLDNKSQLNVDHVIVAIGVEPNTKLAESSQLEVDPTLGGFVVNAELEARTDLYVAGDCSCFYDPKLGRRRVEHHDHAVVSGRLAGENMAGASNSYLHQSMFWSDLGPDVGYEAIGIVDSSLPTVGVFAKDVANVNAKENAISANSSEPLPTDPKESTSTVSKEDDYSKGVVFYLRNETIVGILLWNVFNRMSTARQVLRDDRKFKDLNEVAKLFKIHDD